MSAAESGEWIRAVTTVISVRVNNPEAIARCFTDEWKSNYYEMETTEEVVDHFAFNAAANGYADASLLDGWADLEPGEVTMRVLSHEVES